TIFSLRPSRGPRRIPPAARTEGKDGADRAVDVQVGGAVHRVAGDHEAGRSLALVHLDGLGRLLGDERGARPALAERSRHDLVAPDVKLLDMIAREGGAARVAQLVPQRGVR